MCLFAQKEVVIFKQHLAKLKLLIVLNNLPAREHEFREDLPQTWLRMTLTEGKYHQIRKMVSAVYHDCKRLDRVSIEDLALENLQPGEVKEIKEEDFFQITSDRRQTFFR